MYNTEAYLTKDISYVKNKISFSAQRGQKVTVDVMNSVAFVNGDHIHIDYDEYILTSDFRGHMPMV